VEGRTIGSEFGFPRVGIKKLYKWYCLGPLSVRKKMNFTTDLPKGQPLVSYIVASAIQCAKYFPEAVNKGPCYRMHAVVLKDNGKQASK